MSGTGMDPSGGGPALSGAVREVRGVFPSDAALQDAMTRLNLAGFDRADLSVPDATPVRADATPERGAENPTTPIDSQQARTLGTSLAASVGAMAAAGVVIATGGAALPAVAAAVAGGAGLGGIVQGITGATATAKSALHEDAASRGELVLSVRLTDPSRQASAEQTMRDAGASRVEAVALSST